MLWRLTFQLIPLAALGAAVVFGVLPLRLPRRWLWLSVAVLALAFSKFAVFSLVGGDAFTPMLPAPVIWALGWAYGAAMFYALFAGIAWAVDLLPLLFRRPVGLRFRRIRAVALAAAAVALASWGMFEGVRTPPTRSLEVVFDDLPAEFDGYRIVHLSDLHCSSAAREPRFRRIVDRVNALDPDLVAITGDFVDGLPADRLDDLAPLRLLRARDGVVGCTGNHEMYWRWDRWCDVLTGFGIVFPEETGPVEIRRGESSIFVGGMRDRAFFCLLEDWRVDGAFAGVPADAFRVLLCHRPFTAATGAAEAGVSLQLSGHTHGGAMPLLSLLVARFNEGHVRGLFEFAPGRFLHVSPGTGQWAGFPLRILNPAEITVIVLRRR